MLGSCAVLGCRLGLCDAGGDTGQNKLISAGCWSLPAARAHLEAPSASTGLALEACGFYLALGTTMTGPANVLVDTILLILGNCVYYTFS